MDRGKTLQTVSTYRCPYCGHQDSGVWPEDAGFSLADKHDGAVKCPECGETMNRPL